MHITPATLDDVLDIAKALANHYSSLNQAVWYDLYRNTSIDNLSGHIATRIEDQESKFHYFVTKEQDERWFVNTMIEWERWQLLVLIGANSKVCNLLLAHAVAHLKSLWAKSIIAEESENTPAYKELIHIGFKEYSRNLILS